MLVPTSCSKGTPSSLIRISAASDTLARNGVSQRTLSPGFKSATTSLKGFETPLICDDNENKDEEEEEAYKCILCVKAFKSYAQLAQHMTSKAHRKAEKDAAKGEKGKKKGAPAFVKRGKQSNNDNDNVEY